MAPPKGVQGGDPREEALGDAGKHALYRGELPDGPPRILAPVRALGAMVWNGEYVK